MGSIRAALLRYFGDVRRSRSIPAFASRSAAHGARAFSSHRLHRSSPNKGATTRLDALDRNATRYVAFLSLPCFSANRSVTSANRDRLVRDTWRSCPARVMSVFRYRGHFRRWRGLFAGHRSSRLHGALAVLRGDPQPVARLVLDPTIGAIGAAIANGIAQSVAVGWARASALRIKLPARFLKGSQHPRR